VIDPITLRPPGAVGANATEANLAAAAWWSDPANHAARKKLLPMLAQRKKTGTKTEPVRRVRGELPPEAIETAERERREEVAADLMRLMSWCQLWADVESNDIGKWRDGRVHYPSRKEIAAGAGFDHRYDAEGRARCPKLDDRLDDAIAAGLLFRLCEDASGRPSVFKLKALAWAVCGATVKRALAAAAKKKQARQEARPPKPPAMAAAVGGLARALADPDRAGRPAVDPAEQARRRADYARSLDDAENTPEARGWPPKPPPR
jgi:hypothetical protein